MLQWLRLRTGPLRTDLTIEEWLFEIECAPSPQRDLAQPNQGRKQVSTLQVACS
jgi:hypothetical protein